jgi:3-deoxy-D-manno-octulosonate 8-phosphate phosphatase (KDO 8-P phosphatase)
MGSGPAMSPARARAARATGRRGAMTPALARRIRFVGFDVDGVLTDGGIYLGDAAGQPIELKRFDIQDGIGIKLLQKAGIITAIITGRVSKAVALRARELGVDDVIQDPHARKLPALKRILELHGLGLDEAAFVGDDLPDLSVLEAVALPVVVANATPDAARVAKVRLERRGGHGAVREFVELLLRARGEWDALVMSYVRSRITEDMT